MSNYINKFNTRAEYNEYIATHDKPYVGYIIDEKITLYGPTTFADSYLTTEALEAGTISFNIIKPMGTDYIKSR